MDKEQGMTITNRKSQGYSVTAILAKNTPEKPKNYIENMDLMTRLEALVATLGYDLRMSAPSHSIGHFTHPEWGHRLVNQYKTQGQVLVLLNQTLGILNQAAKIENLQSTMVNNLRGARKANLYKQFLFDAVGKARFDEISETLKLTYPELFTNNPGKHG